MTPEPFDWNELGWLGERHKALVAAKEALSPELLRDVEGYWKSGDLKRPGASALQIKDFSRPTGGSEAAGRDGSRGLDHLKQRPQDRGRHARSRLGRDECSTPRPFADLRPQHLVANTFSNRSASGPRHATVILFDLLNDHLASRGYAAHEIAESLERVESSNNVYLYLLTMRGTLYPVRGLPGAGEEGPANGPGWAKPPKVSKKARKKVKRETSEASPKGGR